MGNAAVMGLVSHFRYILLSDLLLETMSDEQIEAVFAHEVGHVVHKHLIWSIALLATLMFGISGPGQWLADHSEFLQKYPWATETVQTVMFLGIGVGLFALVFGFVSRRLERQADVFAARTIEEDLAAAKCPGGRGISGDGFGRRRFNDGCRSTSPRSIQGASFVGQHGAAIFCSALQRICRREQYSDRGTELVPRIDRQAHGVPRPPGG